MSQQPQQQTIPKEALAQVYSPLTPPIVAKEAAIHGLKGMVVGAFWGFYQGISSMPRGTPLRSALPACVSPIAKFALGFGAMMISFYGTRDIYTWYIWYNTLERKRQEREVIRAYKPTTVDERRARRKLLREPVFLTRHDQFAYNVDNNSLVKNLAGSTVGAGLAGLIFALFALEGARRTQLRMSLFTVGLALAGTAIEYVYIRNYHLENIRMSGVLKRQEEALTSSSASSNINTQKSEIRT